MQPTPPIAMTDWTWKQRLRFFLTGALLTALATLGPVGGAIWYWLSKWGDDPIDWTFIRNLVISCAAVPVYQYYREHKALLRFPPGLTVPFEFQPSLQSKSVQVEASVTKAASGQPMLTKETTTVEKESVPLVPVAETQPSKGTGDGTLKKN